MTARTPGLAASLVLLGALMGALAAPPARAEGARVAVLPVVVHSFDGREYLQAALADMLSARLEQVPGIVVVRVRDAEIATTDLEAARAAADERGAGYVLYGSYTQFGEGASLDLHCAGVASEKRDEDDEAEGRAVFIQAGAPGDIIPALDDVAEKVARYVLERPQRVSTPPPSPAGASGAPSSSEGDDLRRRVEALERAVFDRTADDVPEVDLRSELRMAPAP